MINAFRFGILVTGLFILGSCTTYYIPIESFKQQFSDMDSSKMKMVTTRGPAGDKVSYKTYPIDSIQCIDSKGSPVMIKISPSIEIRFTDSNNRRTTYYFDLISVNETSVSGIRSRFMPFIHKTIPINAIKKIEVQDGRKNFHYVN